MENVTHLDKESLDLLMPMHLILDAKGIVRNVGPTLRKLRPENDFLGL
ncbi:MAG: hypothetical protein ACJAR9_001661, partial [Celeribacter sp.]